MDAKDRPKKVFLDANVVIRAGRPPGGMLIDRIVDLVKAEFVSVVTTDLTMAEVAKKHTDNDYKIVREVARPRFRALAHDVLGADLPQVEEKEIWKRLADKYRDETTRMFVRMKARTLSIDDVKPSVVFRAYNTNEGFFSGEGKRDQFPDAFIFERLKPEAKGDDPLIIVSDDGDFKVPAKAVEHLTLVRSISDLFKMFGFEVKEPDIFTYIDDNHDLIREMLEKQLAEWGLLATDVKDASIEQLGLSDITLSNLAAFDYGGESILVVGSAEMIVNVSYTHPDWETASYDSEDKILLPFRDVSGETEVTVDADFSMTILVDDDGKPSEIEDIEFRNDNFIYIDLNPDGWPYK
ncbi:hypothetical protein EHS39_23750 [Ensifer sp. MPMI2T]|nr:hypothetical protein EHS39_23750 [Ensifer sp. MPMI2T]